MNTNHIVAALAVVACLSFASSVVAQVLFGSANDGPNNPGDLYTIDPSTGNATLVGPIGFNVTGAIDFHPVTGVLYATARRPADATPVLITIDTSDGSGTEVGPLVNIPESPDCVGGALFDLSFRNSDNTLFSATFVADAVNACGCDNPADIGLATIDISTGLASQVGPFLANPCDSGNSIAFSPLDVLYLSAGDPGSVSVVNQSTGAAESPVALSPSDDINAMDYHPITGVLYVSIKVSASNWSIGTLDPLTGAVTVIGTTVNRLDGLAWQPPPPPCPADFDGNGVVNAADLAELLSAWGACPE